MLTWCGQVVAGGAPAGFFKGDADNLVDRLIAACETKVAPSAAYTGFGRDLVPFYGDADSSPETVEFTFLEDRCVANSFPLLRSVCPRVLVWVAWESVVVFLCVEYRLK